MTSTPIHDDLTVAYELRMLDNLLSDECRCEGLHRSTICSVSVVAVSIQLCIGRRLVCRSIFDHQRSWLAKNPDAECRQCWETKGTGVKIVDCWRIIPV